MQRRSIHTFLKIGCVFCVVRAEWFERIQLRRVKFQDASLPGYELGSRGRELRESRQSKVIEKKWQERN
jgi:hypothetical protein